jgi:defect-in-organelle-trafficking protein DotB
MRTIPADPPDYDKIGLSLTFVLRCCPPKGIVLIAGVTGSGKSTTLAAVIKYILTNNTPIKGNIITHEEPIEFTYDNVISHHSIIVQSQIPECFKSFPAANREAMRRKPAAIVVGELRDTETISSAIEASLTGHPAFATIHSSSITDIISRIVGLHPTEEKETALFNIISTCKMLIAQRLVKKRDGNLMAVQEYLCVTDEIRKDLMALGAPLEQNVNQYISSLMDKSTGRESEFASQTFKVQGEKLYEEGIIGEDSLILLTSDS